MNSRLIFWGIGSAALALAVMFAPAAERVDGLHVARGYDQIIRSIFAERGWLWLQPAEGAGDSLPQVALSPSIADLPVVRRFVASSYLREDLASADPAVWELAGERVVGVSPHRHSMPGPFSRTDVWRGEIAFLETSAAGLWLVDPVRGTELPLRDEPQQDPVVLPVFDEDQPEISATSGTYHLLAANGSTIGRIFQIGDRAMIAVSQDTPVLVTVDGLDANPRRGRTAYQALASGSVITLTGDAGLTRQFRIEGEDSTISRYSPFLGRRRNTALQYLAEPLELAMTETLSSTSDGGEDQPFVTTLNRDVQIAAQTTLAQVALKRGEAQDPFRAAATIMDTMTGEVLALASFPRLPEHLPTHLRATLPGRRLIRADHNFSTLPVGSSIKPVFAAAIVSAHDDFRNLRLQGTQCPFETLLWIDVERPATSRRPAGLNDEFCNSGEIDFTTFLQRSSNRYAMALMLLAAQRDLDSPSPISPLAVSDPYFLNGAWHTEGLATLFPIRGRSPAGVKLAGFPGRLGLAWPNRLNEAFEVELDDVDPDQEQSSQDRIADVRQIGFWGEGLSSNTAAIGVLAGVSPEREMLDLGAVDHVTNDYLQLILGGGSSRWTTIKMAEMFSQLVTGRRIHATLNHGDPRSGSASRLTPSSLEAVRTGMRAAVLDGTARPLLELEGSLQSLVGEDVEVRVFAKTGTPTIERQMRTPENAAVNRLIGQGLVSSDGDGRWRIGRRPSQAVEDKTSLVRAIQADPRAMAVLASERARPGAVADYILVVRARSDLQRRGVRGALLGLQADLEPEKFDGSVVGVVVALYRTGEAVPRAGLTVFVNFQDKWVDPSCGAPNMCFVRRFGQTDAFRRAVKARADALREAR